MTQAEFIKPISGSGGERIPQGVWARVVNFARNLRGPAVIWAVGDSEVEWSESDEGFGGVDAKASPESGGDEGAPDNGSISRRGFHRRALFFGGGVLTGAVPGWALGFLRGQDVEQERQEREEKEIFPPFAPTSDVPLDNPPAALLNVLGSSHSQEWTYPRSRYEVKPNGSIWSLEDGEAAELVFDGRVNENSGVDVGWGTVILSPDGKRFLFQGRLAAFPEVAGGAEDAPILESEQTSTWLFERSERKGSEKRPKELADGVYCFCPMTSRLYGAHLGESSSLPVAFFISDRDQDRQSTVYPGYLLTQKTHLLDSYGSARPVSDLKAVNVTGINALAISSYGFVAVEIDAYVLNIPSGRGDDEQPEYLREERMDKFVVVVDGVKHPLDIITSADMVVAEKFVPGKPIGIVEGPILLGHFGKYFVVGLKRLKDFSQSSKIVWDSLALYDPEQRRLVEIPFFKQLDDFMKDVKLQELDEVRLSSAGLELLNSNGASLETISQKRLHEIVSER